MIVFRRKGQFKKLATRKIFEGGKQAPMIGRDQAGTSRKLPTKQDERVTLARRVRDTAKAITMSPVQRMSLVSWASRSRVLTVSSIAVAVWLVTVWKVYGYRLRQVTS
ncbi:hypothetical protein J6590_087922 [Homalodisca vitripennis]|nr:hypothetical protein J6590_087922 [Homalodisca vitripennis]